MKRCLNCGEDAIERVEHNSEQLDVCQSCGDASKAVNQDLVQTYNGPSSPGRCVSFFFNTIAIINCVLATGPVSPEEVQVLKKCNK